MIGKAHSREIPIQNVLYLFIWTFRLFKQDLWLADLVCVPINKHKYICIPEEHINYIVGDTGEYITEIIQPHKIVFDLITSKFHNTHTHTHM